MYRSIIAALLMAVGTSYGQSTSTWQTVTMQDGTSAISTNGTQIGDVRGTFRPAYGSFQAGSTPLATALSVVVTNGTISSGTVTNTRAIDDSYLVVNESGVFNVDFTFQSGGQTPHAINFKGRYEGNPSHNIKLLAYDYNNSAWSNVTDAVDDIPSGSTDVNLSWTMRSPGTDYESGGESKLRFLHIGSAVGSHNVYFDYVAMLYGQTTIATAGVYYAISNVMQRSANNLTADTNTATFTTVDAGDYDIWVGGSGTGGSNVSYIVRVETNGVDCGIGFWRTIGTEGEFGNASDCATIPLGTNVTIQPKISADTDDTFASFIKFHFNAKKIGDTP